TLLLDEESSSKEESIDTENKKSTVNDLLQIKENDETYEPEEETEDSALIETKHSLINSPWSRFAVVGGGAAVVFLMIYLFLGPIMNGSFAKKESPKSALIATTVEKTKESKKDGDVYAKLALQRQADELAKLNGQKTKETLEPQKPIVTPTPKDLPEKSKTTSVQQAVNSEPPRKVATANEPVRERMTAPLPRTVIRYLPSREASLPSATTRQRSSTPLLSVPTVRSQTVQRQTEITAKPTDPIAELERLRSIGSAGRINYIANTSTVTTDNRSSSDNTDGTDYIPRRRLSGTTVQSNRLPSKTEVVAVQPEISAIEQLKPRWTPTVVATADSMDAGTRQSGDYSSDEAGIIEGKPEQYLVIGEHAAATLETPLIWSPGSGSQLKPQFVAQLSEPLKSNTGEGIPAGTQISVEMLGVEPSGRAIAQVTAILKDGTEYPVSAGAITINGDQGKPLIAHQYQKKGGEIFSLDAGLGLVSGLAKVGEVINQPNTQTSISQSGVGFSSSQSSSNGRRSIGAALLEGSFGAISEQVRGRNQKALEEIAARPNIFVVKKGTKILITVNRSMKL
ncbi:MAG: TrbI/VirB10 family protein, partial [Rhizonema sp. NSF051]|nr:TrbI/VirB10 family protein [Rhizonema sp. NSF051]